jgi:hypothetical protein
MHNRLKEREGGEVEEGMRTTKERGGAVSNRDLLNTKQGQMSTNRM